MNPDGLHLLRMMLSAITETKFIAQTAAASSLQHLAGRLDAEQFLFALDSQRVQREPCTSHHTGLRSQSSGLSSMTEMLVSGDVGKNWDECEWLFVSLCGPVQAVAC